MYVKKRIYLVGFKMNLRNSSDDPVAKTLCCQRRGHRFYPGQGTRSHPLQLRDHMAQLIPGAAKN